MADGDVINRKDNVAETTITSFNGSTLFSSTSFTAWSTGIEETIVNTFWFNYVPATATYYTWNSVGEKIGIPRDGVPTLRLVAFMTTPVTITSTSGTINYTSVIIGATAVGVGPVRLSSTISVSASTSLSQPASTAPALSTTAQVSTPSSTAAASTSTPSHTSTSNSSSSGISTGAAAGIGIGCAIAGALIAFALLFFCMRKRGSRRGTSAADGAGGYTAPTTRSPDEKIPLTGVGVFGGAGIGALVENNLPQPVEDQAIVESLSKLRSSIKNHVQSFYHSSPTNVGDVNQEALEALGDELPMPSSMLRLQLSDPGSRNAALRFCIAFAIISRLGFRSSPSDTLLPPEVAGCFQSMRGMETNVKVREAFLSRWRAITSTLMQPTYGRNAFPVGDARSSNVNKLLDLLDSILYPFASNSQDSFQRRKNLEEILKRAAGVAFVLFSQPSAWQCEWEEEARANEPGSLVVFPALLQTVDETGRSLNPPQAFSQVEVSR